jgi:phosphoglycerate dehydrogenase-like enzyme
MISWGICSSCQGGAAGIVAAMPRIRAAVTPEALAAVRERAPAGAEVVALEPDAALAGVEFLVPRAGDRSVIEMLERLEDLRVVQVLSAGTDWIEPHVPEQAILCSARGARDGPVAEWILGALLGASSGLLRCAAERVWERRELRDLGSWTVLIVGMGSIGHHLARHLEPLGTKVIGVGSHAHDDVAGIDELPRLLPRADAVVVLAPLTEATRGLIGADELGAMRDGSVLVNAARGPVVDADALLAELAGRRLEAVLDVTDPEPLPPGHPLWSAPGTLAITPHIAGDSAAGHARAAALAGEQLARYARGEELHNVVAREGRPPGEHPAAP